MKIKNKGRELRGIMMTEIKTFGGMLGLVNFAFVPLSDESEDEDGGGGGDSDEEDNDLGDEGDLPDEDEDGEPDME